MSEAAIFSYACASGCGAPVRAEGATCIDCLLIAAAKGAEKIRKIAQDQAAREEAERLNPPPPPEEARSITPEEARDVFRSIDPLAAEYFRQRLLALMDNMLFATHPLVADQVRAFIDSYLLHEAKGYTR